MEWFETPTRCLIIAEVAQSHDGSLGAAHAYIDAVARAGADVVKFQTHIAAAESTFQEPWRVQFSSQDATRYDYWKRMEFTAEQWCGLVEHTRRSSLAFLSSPFSMDAVDLLERVGVAAWKVAAGEVTNLPMLDRMARGRKPMLISSGMSSWSDLDCAVATARRHQAPVAVLQCTSHYPCPPEKLGLNVIQQLRERYGCPVGFSDHSGTIHAGLAAVTLGASILEVHVTLSRECFGPDVAASITAAELAQLVQGVRFIESAIAHPVDKDSMAAELSELRMVFGKSLVAARDLPAGCKLVEADIALKKPGTGLPPSRLLEIIGRRVRRPVAANTLLSEEDLELSVTA